MNKRQLEVQKALLEREAEAMGRLKKIYTRASKDCAAKIADLSARTDMENLKTIIWQKQYQQALKKQIDGILNKLNTESFETIADYLAECYENGFFGTMYDLQGQGIPLLFPIDQEEAATAVQVDSKISGGLYRRMGEDVGQLKDSIRSELSRGVANGASWNMVAKQIAFGMSSPFMKACNRAIGIARTEGHRIQQEAALHCQQQAKSRGADVLKQWDSTMDGLTRPHHRELDGQVREIEEPFEVAGRKAMYPGGFGDPSEDCNCRCCLVQTGRWELSEEQYHTKWDGEKDRLVRVKAKTYNEFKGKAKEIIGGSDLDKAAKSDLIKLLDTEQHALNQYLSSDSYKINDKLRRMEHLSEQESVFIQALDAALDKMPEYAGTVYRSVSDFGIDDVDAYIKAHVADEITIFNSYLSAAETVYDESFPIQYVIQSKHGKDIRVYNQQEQEILFKRNSKFLITKVKGNTIYMEEV